MASIPQDFKFFTIQIRDIFVLLVPLEISSHYRDINNFHWQFIMNEIFSENVWFKCLCLHSHKTYCDVLLITYELKFPCPPTESSLSVY